MRIVKKYSYKHGAETLQKERPAELAEAIRAIEGIDIKNCQEKKAGCKELYSPSLIVHELLDKNLLARGWSTPKVPFGEAANIIEGDAQKNGVGLEIQFGRYAFLSWDSLRKMAILSKEGVYKYGIEVAPMASLRQRMSKGVGSFEQIVERLEKQGNPELEIPVVVLGIGT
jgi:hypothetical protein